MVDLLLKDEVYSIIGTAMAVHKEMGSGFGEAIYQECMEIELKLRRIQSVPQAELRIHYKGQLLDKTYIADFLCFGSVVVEIKALSQLFRHRGGSNPELSEGHGISSWPVNQFR